MNNMHWLCAINDAHYYIITLLSTNNLNQQSLVLQSCVKHHALDASLAAKFWFGGRFKNHQHRRENKSVQKEIICWIYHNIKKKYLLFIFEKNYMYTY